MSALVPARTILEKDVNIVLSLREIDELNNIIVVQCLQSPHLVLQCMDKEIFRERLVFGEVDLIDEMLLLNHLAGHFFTSFAIKGQISCGKAALPQNSVLYRVFGVNHFEGVKFFHLV